MGRGRESVTEPGGRRSGAAAVARGEWRISAPGRRDGAVEDEQRFIADVGDLRQMAVSAKGQRRPHGVPAASRAAGARPASGTTGTRSDDRAGTGRGL
jgi:hypothetical protein